MIQGYNIRCNMYCCTSHLRGTEPWVRISPNGKLAYYKVPKCMSTSIEGFWGQTPQDQMYPDDSRLADCEDSFTVVRNPYSRVESLYRYRFGSPNFRLAFSKTGINPYMGLEDFIRFMMTYRNHHWEIANRFVPENVGHVFKMENLEPFWQFLNIASTAMPHRNSSPKDPIVWTPTAKRIVQDEYAEDFARFGYKI